MPRRPPGLTLRMILRLIHNDRDVPVDEHCAGSLHRNPGRLPCPAATAAGPRRPGHPPDEHSGLLGHEEDEQTGVVAGAEVDDVAAVVAVGLVTLGGGSGGVLLRPVPWMSSGASRQP